MAHGAASNRVTFDAGSVSFDFKINVEGIREVLRSEELQSAIDSQCDAIKSRADAMTPNNPNMENPNYYTHDKSDARKFAENHGFAIGRVAMGNPYCMAHNLKHNTLIKALH